MPKVAIVDITGKQVGEYELSENTFGQPVNQYVLHEVVRAIDCCSWQEILMRNIWLK